MINDLLQYLLGGGALPETQIAIGRPAIEHEGIELIALAEDSDAKIERNPANPLYVQTVRGIGYRLVITT